VKLSLVDAPPLNSPDKSRGIKKSLPACNFIHKAEGKTAPPLANKALARGTSLLEWLWRSFAGVSRGIDVSAGGSYYIAE